MDMLPDMTNYGNPPDSGPLRPGGQLAESTSGQEADLPSTLSRKAKAQQDALRLVRDCAAGPDCIRACGSAYLPQDPGEKAEAYRSRLLRSVFFNVFGETIEGLTGLVFAKDPVFGNDVPPLMRQHAENIDNAGTHLDVFAATSFRDAMTAGHTGILVDFPQTGGKQNPYQESQGDIRPYWVPILKDDIISWRTTVIHGRTILSQLVIRECQDVPNGMFGDAEQVRYRVLYRDDLTGAIRGRLLEVTKDKRVVEVIPGGWDYPTQDEIPFVEVVTSGRLGLLESKPPLLDLAYLNIAHYQQWSDRAVSAHKTCVPIWVETGIDPEPIDGPRPPIVIGPNSARTFSNPAAKAGYQSHDGAALAEVTKIIEEIKSDMAVLGLAMLAPNKRVAETAEAKRMDKSASDSKLGVAARGLQDGLERALYFHARYLKLPSGGSIEINRDYDANAMAPDVMQAYAVLADKLGLPPRLILEELQKGGRIPDDANLDVLEQEMAATAAAKAAQLALEAQASAPQPPMSQAA